VTILRSIDISSFISHRKAVHVPSTSIANQKKVTLLDPRWWNRSDNKCHQCLGLDNKLQRLLDGLFSNDGHGFFHGPIPKESLGGTFAQTLSLVRFPEFWNGQDIVYKRVFCTTTVCLNHYVVDCAFERFEVIGH